MHRWMEARAWRGCRRSAGPENEQAARGGLSGGSVTRQVAARDGIAYFRPAALRSSAALSVFSHENAVNLSPLASLTSCGVRPKWP